MIRKFMFLAAILGAGLCAAAPAAAWEFVEGGYVCNPGARVTFNACGETAARESRGAVVLDGWYKSAGTLLLGSPKAGTTARSEFLFHGSGAYREGRSPWDGFIGNDPQSKRMMERSAWGRRIQAHLEAIGALDTPAYTTLSGAELIVRFGVPACNGPL